MPSIFIIAIVIGYWYDYRKKPKEFFDVILSMGTAALIIGGISLVAYIIYQSVQ